MESVNSRRHLKQTEVDSPRSMEGKAPTGPTDFDDRYVAATNELQMSCGFSDSLSIGCHVILVGLVVVLLLQDDGDCETPIRMWLQVYAAVDGGTMTLTALLGLCLPSRLDVYMDRIEACLTFISVLYTSVWFVLGNLWLYGDEHCEEAFQSGYIATMAILLFYYVAFFIGCCLCSFTCCLAYLAKPASGNKIH